MVNGKTPKECFDELEEALLAIPEKEIVYTTMPFEVAMQEGQRVAALVNKHGDRLKNSDIDQIHLDTIFERSGAFAYCVGVVDSFVKIAESHEEIYPKKKIEGYEVRKDLIQTLEYVFRSDRKTLDAIEKIKRGAGDLDMIKDLNAIHMLCMKNADRLSKAHVDQSLIEKSLQLYKELSQLTAKLDIDPKRIDEAKKMCNRAWTYLWESMKEIYAAGKYVFFKEPEIQELFYIDYYQNMGKDSNKNAGDKANKSEGEASKPEGKETKPEEKETVSPETSTTTV